MSSSVFILKGKIGQIHHEKVKETLMWKKKKDRSGVYHTKDVLKLNFTKIIMMNGFFVQGTDVNSVHTLGSFFYFNRGSFSLFHARVKDQPISK